MSLKRDADEALAEEPTTATKAAKTDAVSSLATPAIGSSSSSTSSLPSSFSSVNLSTMIMFGFGGGSRRMRGLKAAATREMNDVAHAAWAAGAAWEEL